MSILPSQRLQIKPKFMVAGAIITILILTLLEFPAPIGFETRPQGDVSKMWLILFLAILISEITALALVFKWPISGAYAAITAGILNILQVFADQFHLMQPEVASMGYTLLEFAVGILSIFLIHQAWKIRQEKN